MEEWDAGIEKQFFPFGFSIRLEILVFIFFQYPNIPLFQHSNFCSVQKADCAETDAN